MAPARAYETSSHVLGHRGEQAAARWYVERGFTIIDRNWRCNGGEIDVIASCANQLVFCEVKARASSRHSDPALAIDYQKQRRVRRAAAIWLTANYWAGDVRFDAAIVVSGKVRMIEAAF